MSGNYILNEQGEPEEVVIWRDGRLDSEALTRWSRWFEKADRRVALDVVGHYKVSTVFLGLDHNFAEGGPPILWETMIFDQDAPVDDEGFTERFPQAAARAGHSMLDLEQARYSSKADALRGHAEMVDRARLALKLEGPSFEEQATDVRLAVRRFGQAVLRAFGMRS